MEHFGRAASAARGRRHDVAAPGQPSRADPRGRGRSVPSSAATPRRASTTSARRSTCPGPAIYRHFSSKEEILVEAIKLAADEVHAVNGRAREETADPRDPPRRLHPGLHRRRPRTLVADRGVDQRSSSPQPRTPLPDESPTPQLEQRVGRGAARRPTRPQTPTRRGCWSARAIGLITSVATGRPSEVTTPNSISPSRSPRWPSPRSRPR